MREFSRRGPSPAMAVAFVALLLALCGGAVALPGKNSVDSGDLRKGAVRSSDIGKNAVTGRKVKNNSLTGADVVESSLGTVPAAASAGTANSAKAADTAKTADTATDLAPSEGWHEVGAPGEPPFESGCAHATGGNVDASYESVAFYKDKLGVVHLKGVIQCPGSDVVAFRLPPGYRPADRRLLIEAVYCYDCSASVGPVFIYGTHADPNGHNDGAIAVPGARIGLDGVTFRAAG